VRSSPKARIQPFIVTLAMMIAARGLVLAYTGEKSFPSAKRPSGSGGWATKNVRAAAARIVILIAAFALGWLVLNHTRFGRHVYALGDNDEAARLMGLNTARVTIGVYALSGALAGWRACSMRRSGSGGDPSPGRATS
jgi:ribose transport system permease protein